MYLLAKLLSDEPKKLENLILTVLKLLATIWIAQLFFEFKVDLSEFTIQSFFQNFNVAQSLIFILTAFGIWYLLWELVIDLLMGFFIKLLSLIGNPEKTLKWYLIVTNSVKTKNEKIIDSKLNILHFTESIKNENENYPFAVETRSNQLFSVGLVCYVILLNSDINLSFWKHLLVSFLLLNFLFVSIIQNKLHDYYIRNSESIRSKYYNLGQLQKLKNVIEQLEDLSTNFKIEVQRKKIVLYKINQIDVLPNEIHIVPVFFNNAELGEKIFIEQKSKIINMLKDIPVGIICSNFYPTQVQYHKESDSIFAIKGESQEDLFRGLNLFLFDYRTAFYPNDIQEPIKKDKNDK